MKRQKMEYYRVRVAARHCTTRAPCLRSPCVPLDWKKKSENLSGRVTSSMLWRARWLRLNYRVDAKLAGVEKSIAEVRAF